MVKNPYRRSILGFAIQPAQSLSEVDTNGLHTDLISLLFSLAYHPEHISKLTLDLRYVCSQDTSLVAKGLDIVLLVRIDFDLKVDESLIADLKESFRSGFFDLLSLHLLQYEFEIVSLSEEAVQRFLRPFDTSSVVEITRRITNARPFSLTSFQGSSPMTKVVDMLLREEGQCFLSITLQPHLLTDSEVRELEVFGYKSPVMRGRDSQDDELFAAVLNLQQIKQSMQIVFKLTTRIASERPVSQYLVNVIGSEISGQRDFYYFTPPDEESLRTEVQSLQELDPSFSFKTKRVVALDLPSVLLDLVYLFRPEEAVSAFRLPTQRISVAKEKAFRTYPAPVRLLPNQGLRIGTASHPSYKAALPVYITPDDRARHIYTIGKTGTGKSFSLLNMIQQDVLDRGVCVIDPHGDLVDSIFPFIPESRIDDVYYINPADSEYVMGFNFLESPPGATESERDYIIQEVISMLLRLVDYDLGMFGPQAQQWTRFGCMTLMDLPEIGTLTDVPRLFTDREFRESTLKKVRNPIVKQWWNDEFGKISDFHKSEMLMYFTSKFTPMVTAPQVRNIVGQQKSAIDFRSIMTEGKILLVSLSSGQIGKMNSNFLGSMVVSRLLWTALGRAKDPIATRKQFFLYVDEFQNFITESFEQILSEARKYGLSLTIAHQHLDQLRAMGRLGDKIQRAVFGNIGTMICFRVGDDGEYLAKQLGAPVEESSLRNLANRYAVTTMQVEGVPSTSFTMKTIDWIPPTPEMKERGSRIKERARQRGRRIEEVAAEISARFEKANEAV